MFMLKKSFMLIETGPDTPAFSIFSIGIADGGSTAHRLKLVSFSVAGLTVYEYCFKSI